MGISCGKQQTIGVAPKAATVPEVGKPGFITEDDVNRIGIHGVVVEPGYRREKLQPSKEISRRIGREIDSPPMTRSQMKLSFSQVEWVEPP